jgi:cytochrome b6-f complex iron-sulfur subunit
LTDKPTRRDFGSKVAFGSFWAAIATASVGVAKLLMPNVTPEASTRVKLGHPEEFPSGTSKVFADRNLFVFSDDEGIWAISAVCTHLGCVVSRLPDGQFDCPCHGSRFNASGKAFSGPAPRGLDWLAIRRAPNGILYADTALQVPSGTVWRRA